MWFLSLLSKHERGYSFKKVNHFLPYGFAITLTSYNGYYRKLVWMYSWVNCEAFTFWVLSQCAVISLLRVSKGENGPKIRYFYPKRRDASPTPGRRWERGLQLEGKNRERRAVPHSAVANQDPIKTTTETAWMIHSLQMFQKQRPYGNSIFFFF